MDPKTIQCGFSDLDPSFITDRLTPEQAFENQLAKASEWLGNLALEPRIVDTNFRVDGFQATFSFYTPSQRRDDGLQYAVFGKAQRYNRRDRRQEGQETIYEYDFDLVLEEFGVVLDAGTEPNFQRSHSKYVQLQIAFVAQDVSTIHIQPAVNWIEFNNVLYKLNETGLLVDRYGTPASSEVYNQLARFFEIFNWLSQPPESAVTSA